MNIKGDKSSKIKSTLKGIITNIRKMPEGRRLKAEEIEEAIFHIHGGGFVSMSSSTHRNHTIRWANML